MLFIASLLYLASFVSSENVLTTEVLHIPINPALFNWTHEGITDQFQYHASLQNTPDLPHWINYVYSNTHQTGFLYGVPPSQPLKVIIQIVGLNTQTYESKVVLMPIIVEEKLSPARFEVHLKIDNLNVVDMFDPERLNRLMDVFKKRLWKNSEDDLYLTYLASAVDLGARLPLKPDDKEGVVLRLGSTASLSEELLKLQEEVKPLWKLQSCPRDFKRTTVERLFRDAGFALDWCTFRLLEDNSSQMQHVHANLGSISTEPNLVAENKEQVSIYDVPERNYQSELVLTIMVPMTIMTILALVLSLILCFHHEGIEDPSSEEYFDEIFHLCTDYYYSRSKGNQSTSLNQLTNIQQATQQIRNFSTSREFSCLSPESSRIARAITESPPGTIARGIHCRPSPPPYVKPRYQSEF